MWACGRFQFKSVLGRAEKLTTSLELLEKVFLLSGCWVQVFWQVSGLWFGALSTVVLWECLSLTADDKMGDSTECGVFDKTLCDLGHDKTC